jgi:non-heme chloroperoxidase
MSTITRDETHNDWGTGQPVVFSHGRPLSADAFEDQKQPV